MYENVFKTSTLMVYGMVSGSYFDQELDSHDPDSQVNHCVDVEVPCVIAEFRMEGRNQSNIKGAGNKGLASQKPDL